MSTPTLIEAAQDIVTIFKMYRSDMPLDVLSAVNNLEQAIEREKAKPQTERGCVTCAYSLRDPKKEPCHSCLRDDWSNWEPKP